MLRPVALLAALIALAAAPAALGATPATTIGTGAAPVITADAAGRAHLAWVTANGQIQTCRVAAGGTACEAGATLPVTSAAGELNLFAPTPDQLRLFTASTCNAGQPSVARYDSGDGGATWSGPVCKTAEGATATPTRGANVLDAQDRFLVGGAGAFNALPGGADAGTEAALPLLGGAAGIATGLIGSGANSRLVAAAATPAGIRYAAYMNDPDVANLPALVTGGSWDGDLVQPGGEATTDAPSLVGGPAGLFLVYTDKQQPGNDRTAIARFDPAARRFPPFPPALDAPGEDDVQAQPIAFEDAAGRLHLVWSGKTVTRYAVSGNGGATFTSPGTLLDSRPADRRIAAGPDGRGWIVFQDAGNPAVRLAPLSATPGQPGATGPGAGGTTTTEALPGAAGTPVRRKSVRVPGGRVTLTVPRSCVARNARFVATVTVQRGNRRLVGLRRVRFAVAGGRGATVRREPFARTLRIARKAKRGGRVRVTARASVRLRGGRSATATIGLPVRICR